MKVKEPKTGGICQSRQGRDLGRYYLIKSVNADGTVMLVDGNFKKLAAPKKKNIKHLKLLPDRAESIAEKLADGRQVFDTEVYSALKTYNNPQKDCEETENV
ncbi:MAG: KOW domain-containing RNA-binding protein [Clostridiales bacterium]|nr:KOW domain-containing RNA-binding protein [Clostridiales bacterium]